MSIMKKIHTFPHDLNRLKENGKPAFRKCFFWLFWDNPEYILISEYSPSNAPLVFKENLYHLSC